MDDKNNKCEFYNNYKEPVWNYCAESMIVQQGVTKQTL